MTAIVTADRTGSSPGAIAAALTWLRLSYRQQRWELILVAIGTAFLAVAMLWFAAQLREAYAGNTGCIEAATTAAPTVTCQAVLERFYSTASIAGNLPQVAWLAPFGMGVLLGAPLVAREIDGRTAQLAWWMSASRVSWLLRRVAFVVIFVVALLGVVAWTSEILVAAIEPTRTLGQDFTFWGQRGPILVARGIGALMVGMLVGAMMGRVLTSVLAAAFVVCLIFIGLALAQDLVLRSEAVPQRMDPMDAVPTRASLVIDYGLETLDGEVISYQEAFERGMTYGYIDEQGRQYASEADLHAGRVMGYDVQLVVPAARYAAVVEREGIAAVALGLVALGLTALVVTRRRPA